MGVFLLIFKIIYDIMNAYAFIIYLLKCPCRYADQRSAPCISGDYIITLTLL